MKISIYDAIIEYLTSEAWQSIREQEDAYERMMEDRAIARAEMERELINGK